MSPAAVIAATLLLAGCGPAAAAPEAPSPAPAGDVAGEPSSVAVQPGAPGQASRTVEAGDPSLRVHFAHTEAEVRFMQNMIHHHLQALDMSGLVPDRTDNPSIRLLANRIDRSQMDEIRMMQRWLAERNEEVPEVEAHHGHHQDHAAAQEHHAHQPHTDHEDRLMAGMLTPGQLQELAEARGAEFDRLFLEYMIFHHDGAIQMVEALFATPGSGQDSEIFRFASHVESDQSIEIARMAQMLRRLP